MSHRTSFAGALVTMAIGAVLAFAVRSSPTYLDLRTTGVILVLGAAADLIIRSLIADSPLLGRESAEVAAVLEPIGEPVLDAAGNPVVVRNPGPSRIHSPVIAPPVGTPPVGTMPPENLADTLVVTDEPYQAGPGQTPSADGSTPSAAPVPPGTPVALTTLTGRPVGPQSDVVAEQRRRWRRNEGEGNG